MVYSTRAFNRIAARDVVGESFFDSFLEEDAVVRPAVGTTLTPLGTSRILIDKRWKCNVEVFPVLSDSKSSNQGLLYYGVIVQNVKEKTRRK